MPGATWRPRSPHIPLLKPTAPLVDREAVNLDGSRAGLVSLVLVAVAVGAIPPRDPAHVGRSSRVLLDWECTNEIRWDDPWSGVRWWAGSDPHPTGPLDTRRRGLPPMHHQWADGVMEITGPHTARFTSDAGGTLTLTAPPPGRFYEASCRLGPLEP